eukprot:COSAG02_NODE_31259_length_536_cov_1.363844_2_plen_50_part_00
MCAQVFAMEGGIFYVDSSDENSEITSTVVLAFAVILAAVGGLLGLVGGA